MQDYKCLRDCVILVNRRTHRQTAFDWLYY